MTSPLAILCSDIHLSHTAPASRAGDWYEAMKYGLQQLEALSVKNEVPIICAGDIFDRWNSPPELINFALEYLPPMYAIPGQHDLPNHSMEEIKRSAYWTLVEAGKVSNLTLTKNISDNFYVLGFPWGMEPHEIEGREDYDDPQNDIYLAVVHSYIWKKGYSYPGAPDNGNVRVQRKNLKGYDAAVYGDNHQGFTGEWKKPDGSIFHLMNCGTFFRRKSDEIDYRPQIGILYSDGRIEPHYLDTSKDEWVGIMEMPKREDLPDMNIEDFIGELGGLQSDSLDFREVLNQRMDELDVSREVRTRVLEALER